MLLEWFNAGTFQHETWVVSSAECLTVIYSDCEWGHLHWF